VYDSWMRLVGQLGCSGAVLVEVRENGGWERGFGVHRIKTIEVVNKKIMNEPPTYRGLQSSLWPFWSSVGGLEEEFSRV
jgi:hypothetical protein